jgi:anti-sigma factor (TIGR02949 family)
MNKQDCTDVFARLSEYLDRELPGASCEEMEKHIAACAPCVQFVESLKKSIHLTRGLTPEDALSPMPEELKQKFRRAFEAAAKRRSRVLTEPRP